MLKLNFETIRKNYLVHKTYYVLEFLFTFLLTALFAVNIAYAQNEGYKKAEEETVKALNAAWNYIGRTDCQAEDPDYYCSGIVIHVFDIHSSYRPGMSYSSLKASSLRPWMPSKAGIEHGSVSFSYLRRDIHTFGAIYRGGIPAGYIFKSIKKLVNENAFKTYNLYCVYPQDANTIGRDDNGCGKFRHSASAAQFTKNNYTQFIQNNNDLSNCKKLGFTFPDPGKYFENFPQNVIHCSLSSDKNGFAIMLKAMKRLIAIGVEQNNEIVIQEWSNYKNSEVPIQAFFYETGRDFKKETIDEAKREAFASAKLYFDKTGIYVPVVEIDERKIADGDPNPFSVGVAPPTYFQK